MRSYLGDKCSPNVQPVAKSITSQIKEREKERVSERKSKVRKEGKGCVADCLNSDFAFKFGHVYNC